VPLVITLSFAVVARLVLMYLNCAMCAWHEMQLILIIGS